MGDDWKKYEFFKHCMLGNEKEVRALLDEGVDPMMKHLLWHDSLPLAWAAASGQIGVMCILIEAGVNPFLKAARDAAKMFKAEQALKFFDELLPLAYEALRAELNIDYVRVDAPGLTHKMSVEL